MIHKMFKEFMHIKTAMISFVSLQNSMSHFKSMPQKSNHDFKEKYSYVRMGILVPARIKEILNKNSCLLSLSSVLDYEKDSLWDKI